MRGTHLWTLALAIIVLLAAGCDRKPKTECLFGDNIPEKDFDPIANAAGDLIMFLEGGQLKEMYDSGTEELKSSQTRDQYKMPLELFIRSFGSLSYSRIEEIYYMNSTSKEERVIIPCNLGEPGVDDLYGMPANRELAVVVFKSQTQTEQVRVVLTLEKEKGTWKLRSISLNPSSMKSRISDYYLKMAQKFREQNHLRVAALYYKAAMLLLELGVNVNEFSTKVISEQLIQIKVDYLPFGEPQLWTMPSGSTFKVQNVDLSYDKGTLFVNIVYLAENLDDQQKLKNQARELAEFVNQNFPEYRLGFDGIRISAVSEKQQDMFATLYNSFLFSELPTPTGVPAMIAPLPGSTAAPVPTAPAAGSTVPDPAAPQVPAPAPPPVPEAPAAGGTVPAPAKP